MFCDTFIKSILKFSYYLYYRMTFTFIHYAHNLINLKSVKGLWLDELSKDIYISSDYPESIEERSIFTLFWNMKTFLDKPKTWSFKDYGNYKKRNELTLPQKLTIEDISNQYVFYDGIIWHLIK